MGLQYGEAKSEVIDGVACFKNGHIWRTPRGYQKKIVKRHRTPLVINYNFFWNNLLNYNNICFHSHGLETQCL